MFRFPPGPLHHFATWGSTRGGGPSLLGVDLGTSHVRVAVLRGAPEGPVIEGLYEAPVPAGAVIEGRWVNPGGAVEALSSLLARQGVVTRSAVLSLGAPDVHLRRLSLPPAKSLERQIADDREMRSLPGLSPDRAVYAGWRIGGTAIPAGSVLAAAARSEAVSWLADLGEAAGLQVPAVDPEAVALANTFRFAVGTPPPRAVLLHLGAERSVAVVLEEGVPSTVYPLREGIRSLVKRMRAASPALTSEAAIEAITADDPQAIPTRPVAEWAAEIGRGVLRAAGGAERLGEVYLTGAAAGGAALRDAIVADLGSEPQILDPLGAFGMESSPGRFGPAYAVAIGVALGALPVSPATADLARLHLPTRRQADRGQGPAGRLRALRPAELLRHPALIGVLAVAAVGTVALTARDVLQNGREVEAREELNRARRQAALLGDSLTAVNSLRARQDSLRRLVSQIDSLDQSRFAWLMLRDELARVRPPLTWLTSLVKTGQDPTTGVIRFSITGHSPSPERASEYARALEGSGTAEGLQTRTRSVEIRSQSVHQFEITGQTRAPGPAAPGPLPLELKLKGAGPAPGAPVPVTPSPTAILQ